MQNRYGRLLRGVADEIGRIVSIFDPDDPMTLHKIYGQLDRYGELLRPWAEANANRMFRELNVKDFDRWRQHSQSMERALMREIASTPVGHIYHDFMVTQVKLITSLPNQAARRVHKLALAGISTAQRPKELAEEIWDTGRVTKARAMLIARTEIARAQSALVMARAKNVGSNGYIWRTMRDAFVRPALPPVMRPDQWAKLNTAAKGSHRLLEGKVIDWNNPPVAGPQGQRAHAGMIFNCRCYAEPIVPDEF